MSRSSVAASGADLAQAARRSNFYIFVQDAFVVAYPGKQLDKADYLEAICFALQRLATSQTSRLMISVAPRHLKSFCGSVCLPAFLLGHDPTLKVMVVSYGEALARDLAELSRSLIESPFYKSLFPDTRIAANARRFDYIRTTRGGTRQARSIGGAVTGFGADVLIIDDLAKASEIHSEALRHQGRTFFDETLYPRLENKSSARILSIQQRLHADDLAAYLLEKGSFEHLCLPSIATEHQTIPLYAGFTWTREIGDVLNAKREPRPVLDTIREEIGPAVFQAQYQQDPGSGGNRFLDADDLVLCEELPDERDVLLRVQSWDTAIKDGPRCSYSVGLTFGWHVGEERWYLLDLYRGRLEYPDLKSVILHLQDLWKPTTTLIEDAALGSTLVDDIRRQHRRFGTIAVPVRQSKLERFLPATDWIKAGGLVIPRSADWFADLKRELISFPEVMFDDQVDALSQFNLWRIGKGQLLAQMGSARGSR